MRSEIISTVLTGGSHQCNKAGEHWTSLSNPETAMPRHDCTCQVRTVLASCPSSPLQHWRGTGVTTSWECSVEGAEPRKKKPATEPHPLCVPFHWSDAKFGGRGRVKYYFFNQLHIFYSYTSLEILVTEVFSVNLSHSVATGLFLTHKETRPDLKTRECALDFTQGVRKNCIRAGMHRDKAVFYSTQWLTLFQNPALLLLMLLTCSLLVSKR